MYGNYANPQFMIDRLTRQKEEIDNLIRSYQNSPQQTPVNNFINTNQTQSSTKDLIEWRVLNENEEVDNLYVANKTLFINDSLMILKGVDGSLEKWEIKKIYPVDKKDEKINQLEEEVKKLKEMINNEHSEPTITTRGIKQSDANAIGNDNRKSKTSTKSVPTEE
jgi:hypothetical protein